VSGAAGLSLRNCQVYDGWGAGSNAGNIAVGLAFCVAIVQLLAVSCTVVGPAGSVLSLASPDAKSEISFLDFQFSRIEILQ
jgi:hypothetical protein